MTIIAFILGIGLMAAAFYLGAHGWFCLAGGLRDVGLLMLACALLLAGASLAAVRWIA